MNASTALRKVRYARFNSSIARAALGLYFQEGRPYDLWFGPLRGLKMYYDRTINFHSILGLWESEIFGLLNALFVRGGLLPKDAVAADVGANIGYYSLWLAKFAVPRGIVQAFEPSAEVAKLLARNIDLNGLGNIIIEELACSDRIGTTDFFISAHHHASSIHADWARAGQDYVDKVEVPTTTLDTFFSEASGRRPPHFIKMDIEGGGTHALPGCARLFETVRPYVLIESHIMAEDDAISHVLTHHAYRAYRLNDRRWVTRPQAIHPDKDGVWGTLLLVPQEHYEAVTAIIPKKAK